MEEKEEVRAVDGIPEESFHELFRKLDVQFLVTDLATDEILYANDKMNASYNVDYDPTGRRCWETYQIDQTKRCDFCPIDEIRKDPKKTIEWEAYNTATGRWFRNTSSVIHWSDGRLAHLEQGVDITTAKKTAVVLEKRLAQQQLMHGISQSFISTDDTTVLIQNALKMAGEFLRADRVLLAGIDQDENIMRFQHTWSQPGANTATEDVLSKSLSVDVVREAFEEKHLDYTACEDTTKEPNADFYASINLASFVTVPVWVRGRLWGILSFEMATVPRKTDASDLYLVEMVGNAIGGVLRRYEIEEEVRDADERTQAMFEGFPMTCTFFGEDFEVIDCNEEAVRMYGLADKQEYLNHFYNISPEFQPDGTRSDEKLSSMLKKTLKSGREVFEFMHLHKDGSLLPVVATMVRVKWKDGYRLASYARDVRKEKAAMAEIERTQDELRTARDKAEVSAKSKTNFLANMSHEIRTPMNAIIGMTNLALESDDMTRVKYCLGKVDDAAGHLLGIINDILDMSKIEAGKMELAPSDFLLDKMLRGVADIANFRAEQKHIDLVIKVDKDVPPAIVADQQRLAQVLTNLLSNAVKFTPDDGKVSLLIHNVKDGEDSCSLLFEVIDTGIGLSEEQISRLFESFEQADGSISRRFGGTGLGLPISKNIVELMDGTIGVESELKKGSRFFFTVDVPKGKSNYRVMMREDIDWANVRLLAVDDDVAVCEYFEDIAATLGLSCKTASGGKEACSLLDSGETFNIIFVDWLMPEIDGIKLTRRIREKYGQDVIVIMISAAEWEQVREEATAAGIDSFISKPLLPSRIIDTVNECLSKRETTVQTLFRHPDEYFGNKRILLAEDIEVNREILAASLEGTGLEIEAAENGKVACEKFRQNPERYDLIFMDIHMPEMDGYTAAKTIRAMDVPRATDIPIVAMTANVFREDIEKCLAAGMDDHIGKPIDLDELMNKLKRYL